jgi:hypothetical protein
MTSAPADHLIDMHAPPSSGSTTLEDPPTTNNSTLRIFQTALGLSTPPSSIDKSNLGLYPSVLSSERYAMVSFYFYDYVLSACVFLQIVLATTLTALGASSASHIAITILGAVNTALAGIVALIKGKGLPNRYRQDWNGWRELRNYIEEREREIAGGRPIADVWAETRIIQDKYAAVRATVETNRPDDYHVLPGQTSLRTANI